MDDTSHYSVRIWSDGQPSDHSECPISEERNGVHAEACTTSKPLLAHTVSLPPRSFGVPDALSLHEYRKNLAQGTECVADLVDIAELKVRRKKAISNFDRPRPICIAPYAESVSSMESGPPPLSPSCSNSIFTQQSEQDYNAELSLSSTDPFQGLREYLVSANLTRPRQNRKRLNTFRQRLEEKSQARGQALELPLSCPRTSDLMLANTQAVATISHGGSSFEILNPRESLDVARIVSFIEDVDGCSIFSSSRGQSRVSSNSYSLDEGLSQFTDASLTSHYSHSLYTSNSTGYSTPKRQNMEIPKSSSALLDRVRSLSDYSIHDYDYWRMIKENNEEHDNHTYHDLVTDPSNRGIASTSDREDEDDIISDGLESSRRLSSPPTFYSEDSDIGEPGSPVYANGDWAQVDERDRGIFFEIPSSYDNYYTNAMSPSYTQKNDPYDPIYFDPHVQSVLAAANAETMGLRGHLPRATDDTQQRGFHASIPGIGNGNTRKHSPSSRKKLKKLFSWRSGN